MLLIQRQNIFAREYCQSQEGDFYYTLAARSVEKIGNYPTADQTLKQSDFIIDGSGYDGKDLVTQVWTVICR